MAGIDLSRCKRRRGGTGEPGPRRGINLLHGSGVDKGFLARGHVGCTAAGSFAVEQLVIERFEGGDRAADDEAGELGAVRGQG